MKKSCIMVTMLAGIVQLSSAETNALIEVKVFKTWVIKGEWNFGNLAIKNTGTAPIPLAKDPVLFELGQLATRSLPHTVADSEQEEEYKLITLVEKAEFFGLLPGETHVYEGRKFYLPQRSSFSDEMRFTISIYLGKGAWLDSEPLTYYGVAPDSEEHVATLTDVNGSRELVAVAYKNERWLYVKFPPDERLRYAGDDYNLVCPVSPTGKIRVEPHEGKGQYRIWDGDKPMVFNMYKSVLVEGPDENDVLGKWTRERKRKADADNAEVRRKRGETGKRNKE